MNKLYSKNKVNLWFTMAALFSFIFFTASSLTAQCPSSISGFIYMGEYNGSKYFCSNGDDHSWHDAISGAAAAGGHLAVINNSGENDFIQNNLLAEYAPTSMTGTSSVQVLG